MSGTRPFGESDIAYITRCRSEGVPFDFPDVIIDGLLATLDAARHASDAQVARMAQHIIDCPDLDYDADGDLADVARAALAAAPAPQPAPPGTKGNR